MKTRKELFGEVNELKTEVIDLGCGINNGNALKEFFSDVAGKMLEV